MFILLSLPHHPFCGILVKHQQTNIVVTSLSPPLAPGQNHCALAPTTATELPNLTTAPNSAHRWIELTVFDPPKLPPAANAGCLPHCCCQDRATRQCHLLHRNSRRRPMHGCGRHRHLQLQCCCWSLTCRAHISRINCDTYYFFSFKQRRPAA
jgi:hypothetical protein